MWLLCKDHEKQPRVFFELDTQKITGFFSTRQTPPEAAPQLGKTTFSILHLYSLLSSKGEAPHFNPNIADFFGIFFNPLYRAMAHFVNHHPTQFSFPHVVNGSLRRFFTRSHSHSSLTLRLQKRHDQSGTMSRYTLFFKNHYRTPKKGLGAQP